MAEKQNDEGLPSTDEMKGRAKEAAGSLTDDEDLKKEGRVDRAVSDVEGRRPRKDFVKKDDDRQR